MQDLRKARHGAAGEQGAAPPSDSALAAAFHWALILAICASRSPSVTPALGRLLSDLTHLIFSYGRGQEDVAGGDTAPKDLAGEPSEMGRSSDFMGAVIWWGGRVIQLQKELVHNPSTLDRG